MTEKLFYQDSHLKAFTAQVEYCEKTDGGYEVVLDRTAFFPEGGGQYADEGKLNDAVVYDVQERNGKITHVVDRELQVGARVSGAIQWDTRFMKMQQHTGEHIVSGIICNKFGYHNVGFHLGSEDCTMDFDGEISREQLYEIELTANQAATKNIEIQVSYPEQSALEQLEYRSKIEILGQVRIVTIPGYDVCACCAPHVKRTGEVGMIKLTNVQRYKGGSRITMLCGMRALADYVRKETQIKKLSSLLSAKEDLIADVVTTLKEDLSVCKARQIEIERELLSYQVKEIEIHSNLVYFLQGCGDAEQPRMLMNLLLERGAQTCAIFYRGTGEELRYVMGSKVRDVRSLAKEINKQFLGRGGGKAEMVQGMIHGNWKEIEQWMQQKMKETLYE